MATALDFDECGAAVVGVDQFEAIDANHRVGIPAQHVAVIRAEIEVAPLAVQLAEQVGHVFGQETIPKSDIGCGRGGAVCGGGRRRSRIGGFRFGAHAAHIPMPDGAAAPRESVGGPEFSLGAGGGFVQAFACPSWSLGTRNGARGAYKETSSPTPPSVLAGRAYNGGFEFDCRTLTRATVMPKQKTHKGVKKRFRLSANGKVKHRGAGTSHLAARMSKKRRRKLRGTRVLSDGKCRRRLFARWRGIVTRFDNMPTRTWAWHPAGNSY